MSLRVRPATSEDLAPIASAFEAALKKDLGAPERPEGGDFAGLRADDALVAELAGDRLAALLSVNWGSVRVRRFVPLSARGASVAVLTHLLHGALSRPSEANVTLQLALISPHTPRALELLNTVGFWPGFLHAVMTSNVPPGAPGLPEPWVALSSLPAGEVDAAVTAARALCGAHHPGLDLTPEIELLRRKQAGDTMVRREAGRVDAIAVCHVGASSEAGPDTLLVKFAALAKEGADEERFRELLGACEAQARALGLAKVRVALDTSRHVAYRALLARKYIGQYQGLALRSPDSAALGGDGCFILDDWR